MSDDGKVQGEAELTARERWLLEAVPAGGAAADEGADAAADAALDDGQLAAFRRGELDDEAAAALAGRLARDPEARALLVAQAEAERDADAMSVARVLRRAGQGRAGQSRSRQSGAGQSRRRVVAVGAALVALAAALILFVGRPSAPEFALDGPYGGVAETRGEETISRSFVPGNRLRLFARPAAPLATPPGCVAVVGAPAPSGETRRTAVDRRFVRVAPNGVCRLDAPVEALFPAFGRYSVALVLLPAGAGSVPDGIPRLGEGIWLVEKIDYRSAELP